MSQSRNRKVLRRDLRVPSTFSQTKPAKTRPLPKTPKTLLASCRPQARQFIFESLALALVLSPRSRRGSFEDEVGRFALFPDFEYPSPARIALLDDEGVRGKRAPRVSFHVVDEQIARYVHAPARIAPFEAANVGNHAI